MKYALCFLAGAVAVTSAVLLAGGAGVGMFVAGGFVAFAITLAATRAIGLARVARFLLAFDEALTNSQRAATPGRRKTEKSEKPNVVSFPKDKIVLTTIQQEVVSALVNLGISMAKAQQNVIEASEGRPGLDFETLFRSCVSQRRASA